jgi:carbamate kinase
MLVVIALGGNALLRRGEPPEAETQRRNVKIAATAMAEVARGHELVVTHGNGPQVGLLALQSEAYGAVRAYPLDLLGAESEGMIGYLIEQELANCLPEREVATLLTQVEVDPEDAAFSNPTKPIGPTYTEEEASRLSRERGWTVARDGEGYRRVVPSPEPRRIIELNAIRLLVKAGVLVVCAGGGGVPVVASEAGALHGVEAVIDKDMSAALLAADLGAEALLLLTDVDAVQTHWREPSSRAIRRASPSQLRPLQFEVGSMGPKVFAACRFVEATGGFAGIGSMDAAAVVLRQEAGTTVAPGEEKIRYYASSED